MKWVWVTPNKVDGMDVVTPARVCTHQKKSWGFSAKLLKKILAIILKTNL